MNALSDREITDILLKNNLKHNGIFMKDQIPIKLKQGPYIVNLQSSTDGNGTHWVLLYYTPNGSSFYFDSFGFIAPEIIHDNVKPYKYNYREIQDLKSSACGYYCIGLIQKMNDNKDKEKAFADYLAMFSTLTLLNDHVLFKYLDQR